MSYRRKGLALDRRMRSRFRSARRGGAIACIDIGAYNTSCLIVACGNAKRPHSTQVPILGFGCSSGGGVDISGITNMDMVERSVRKALDRAEAMAGRKVDYAVATLSQKALASEVVLAECDIAGGSVTERDLGRAFSCLAWDSSDDSREIVHAIPVSYSLDGQGQIENPIGMVGSRLGVDVHLITVAKGTLLNLAQCLRRAHIELVSVLATPYAAALSCLTGDERNLGSACVDIGARSTSIAVFYRKKLLYVDSIPVGAAHATDDIAGAWGFSYEQAERMKTLHGCSIAMSVDERENLAVVAGSAITRSDLIGVIRPRIEDILERVSVRLSDIEFLRLDNRQLVFTGGGSLLPGLLDMAQRIIGFRARLGRPTRLVSAPAEAMREANAVVAGLATYVIAPEIEISDFEENYSEIGLLTRFGQWWSENW